ncbi:hypothetical protein XELAEV_18035021mg [Xenopus laevis]|uniref:Uncharacterized protein n=1 Tax=Xenopus laevis TaxID=8355 RepID=A0A974CH46_XENLA|nr:hypothetical protein XELAEV_18035021mg [Xenopus laevis]
MASREDCMHCNYVPRIYRKQFNDFDKNKHQCMLDRAPEQDQVWLLSSLLTGILGHGTRAKNGLPWHKRERVLDHYAITPQSYLISFRKARWWLQGKLVESAESVNDLNMPFIVIKGSLKSFTDSENDWEKYLPYKV